METLQNVSMAILSGMWTLLVWTWWIAVPVIIYFARKNYKKAEYVSNIKHLVLSIKIPKNNDKGPVAAEMMFASLHGILQPKSKEKSGEVVQEHLSFEIVSTINKIEFYVWTPENLKDFVEGQIYAQYPTAEITLVEDYSKNIDIDGDNKDDCIAGAELSLVKEDIYPIKTFQNFDVDPLAGITGMLSKIEANNERFWIQVLAKPIHDDWRDGSLGHISSKKGGGKKPMTTQDMVIHFLSLPFHILPEMISAIISPMSADEKKKMADAEKKKKEEAAKNVGKLSHAEETELTAIEEKANKLGYRILIRVIYLAKTKDKAEERVKAAYGAFKQFNSTNLNGFQMSSIYTGNDFLAAYRARLFDESGYVLNIEELASLYHLPHVSVETPNIVWTSSKKGEPPANIQFIDADSDPDLTPLAQTTYRSTFKSFGIKRDDRRRHMYVIGKSGTGKSRLLEYLAISDIKKGEGVAIVDPHGELIERVLKYIPKERMDDVIYFNPADKDFPIAFNPLEATPEQREEVANGFVSVLKKLFGYSWGPRLEYVLKHTVMALIEAEGTTMLGIVRMLTDKVYRKNIVGQITDPVVQMFWLKEFSTYNDKMATETVAPILNKVGQFTASPIIRNIVGQAKSTINFADAMNSGKIMLFNLSTGLIGEENSKLLGSMVVTKLQLAAMSRAAIPEDQRKDFFLYVDEFQNFATESFAVILSEARKYRLSLIVANQYIAQMDENVRDAVFGNVGSLISFRVGATDASFLEKEFTPIFEQNDLINLDNRHIYLTMLLDGVSSVPFSAMSLDTPKIDEDLTSVIVALSRKKFGTARDSVEADIRKWYNVDAVIAGVNANDKSSPIPTPNRPVEQSPTAVVKPEEAKPTRIELPEELVKQVKENDLITAEKPAERPQNSQGTQSNEVNPNGNNNRKKKKKKKNNSEGEGTQVDKETLKQIIKDITRPVNEREPRRESPALPPEKIEKPIVKEESKQEPQVIKKDDKTPIARQTEPPKVVPAVQQVQTPIQKHEPAERVVEQKPVAKVEPKTPEAVPVQPKPQEKKEEIQEHFPKEKVVREITPEEFHALKEIKPHEKITIKQAESKEIHLGDTITFD